MTVHPSAGSARAYVETLETYDEIGGDLFEYGPACTLEAYLTFLRPLRIDPEPFHFQYTGSKELSLTSPEMWEAYEAFRRKHAARLEG